MMRKVNEEKEEDRLSDSYEIDRESSSRLVASFLPSLKVIPHLFCRFLTSGVAQNIIPNPLILTDITTVKSEQNSHLVCCFCRLPSILTDIRCPPGYLSSGNHLETTFIGIKIFGLSRP